MSAPDPFATANANYLALYGKAQQAIAANIAYLAIASPTQAQALAQVTVLTRETTAIMRLLLGLLDVTDGT